MLATIRVVAGVLLAAHGLVHLLYLAPDADDAGYPFTLKDSWLVSERAGRPIALGLIATTVAGFVVLALTLWQVPGLATAWPAVLIVAAGASLALLTVFWDTRLLFGVGLDIALIVIVVAQPAWADRLVG